MSEASRPAAAQAAPSPDPKGRRPERGGDVKAWLVALLRRHGLALLGLAVACHLAVVWVLPRVIMNRVMSAQPGDGQSPHNHVVHMPPVDSKARRVVMPSPDLLYSICFYDVSLGPVHVRARPDLKTYWSVALYGDNSDNFFVRNDLQLQGRGLDVWLTGSGAGAQSLPAGAQALAVPSERGVVLMRVLSPGTPEALALIERERKTFECSPPQKERP